MKKLIIFLAIIVALLGGAAGYLLINLNKLVAGLKPKIEQVASEALGAKFSISEIDTSVFPNLKLSLKGISVQGEIDSQAVVGETSAEKLAVRELKLFINLMGLLSGNLVVEELSVVAPELSIIKDLSGVRVAALRGNSGTPQLDQGLNEPLTGQQNNQKKRNKQAGEQVPQAENQPSPERAPALPFALALQGVSVDSGAVRFIDKTQDTKNLKVIELRDFNLKTAASFKDGVAILRGLDSSLSVLSKERIRLVADELAFDLNAQSLRMSKPLQLTVSEQALEVEANLNLKAFAGQASLSSAGINLEKLSGFFAAIAEWSGNTQIASLNLKGQIKPQLKVLLNGVDKEPSFSGQVGVDGVGLSLIAADGIAGNSVQDLTGIVLISGAPKAVKINTSGINLTASSSSFRGALPLKLTLSDLAVDLDFSTLAVRVELPELLLIADGQQLKLGANIKLTDQVLNVSDLKLSGFSGSLNGDLELNMATSSFSNKTQAQNIRLAEAMRFVVGEKAPITGELRYLSSNVSGRLGSDLLQTLQGGAEAGLTNLSLKGFNLLKEVLAELKSLPFISGALLSKVPAELQASVNSDSTPFDEVKVKVNLQSGNAFVRSLEAKSLLFNLAGQGEIKLANNRLNLQTDFSIKPPLSVGLAERVKELRPLLDDERLLSFPLRIEGVPPRLVVYPDPSKLLEKVGRKLLEQKGQKLLKGLLGF